MLAVGSHVTQPEVDVTQVPAALEKLHALTEALGRPLRLIADAGCFSADQCQGVGRAGHRAVDAVNRACLLGRVLRSLAKASLACSTG